MANTYSNIPLPAPTKNPVPSTDIRDHIFGGAKIDEFVTSQAYEYADRFGNKHRTINGINYDANQAMLKYGYITKKSFEIGATLDTPNTVLQWESNGEFYRWDGDWSSPKIVPPGSTPETAGGIGEGKWVGVGDASLRGELISDENGKGDFLIAVKKTASGSVGRTQHDVNNDIFYVEDFGAVGDGITNDSAAVSAMISALGYARFGIKKYNLTGFKYNGDTLALMGDKRPNYSGGALTGGSIIIGMLDHSVTNAYLRDIGHIAVTDGIVLNSGVGSASAGKLYVKDVIGIGTGEAGATHAQLYQGFNDVYIGDVEGNDAQYSVVVKSRSGFVSNVTSRNVRTAGLFIKGDQGSPAGNVGNGAATNLVIDGVNVINGSSNTGCTALFIQSSTELASKVIASKVRSVSGKSAVEIAGGGTGPLQTNSIIVSDIISEATANSALLVTGNPSDFIVRGLLAINPANASAFTISGSSNNGLVDDVILVISNTAITGALAGFMGAVTASRLGNVNVRNPYRNMAVQIERGKVNPGALTGNVNYQNDGNIAVLSGAAWGAVTPRVETRDGNYAVFHGSIVTTGVTSATSPVLGTLPFSFPASCIVEVGIKLRDGTYAATRCYLSGTVIQILTASATSVAEVYLEGLTVSLPRS